MIYIYILGESIKYSIPIMQILFVKNLPSNLTKFDLQTELKKVAE